MTEMDFRQMVELAPQEGEKEQLVLVTMFLSADFKGYSSKKDNLNMSLHLIEGI